jgi:hypothetical protein
MSEAAARKEQTPAPSPEKPASPLKEKWTQWVALTTTVLAVCAAISSLKGGGYSTRVQLMTTKESNKWSYFQSKSIKQHVVETERDLLRIQALDARSPEAKQAIADRVAKLDVEVARYDKEKNEIKAEAEQLSKDEDAAKGIGGNFGLAVMLLQIAIMLSSVGALIKRPVMWVVGLGFGAIGLVYMANGFFGFFA